MVSHQDARGFEQFPFGIIHGCVLPGIVLVPEPEDRAPHQAQAGEGNERISPADQPDGGQHQWRSEGSAPARESPQHPLSGDAFARRQPHAEHAGKDGETTCLAGSEEEANDPERDEVPGCSGQRGKKRPAQDDLQQDPPHPDLIAQQANREPRTKRRRGQRLRRPAPFAPC